MIEKLQALKAQYKDTGAPQCVLDLIDLLIDSQTLAPAAPTAPANDAPPLS